MNHWKLAHASHDEAIIQLCANLNREDPGPKPVPRAHVEQTLQKLRQEPVRGRAMVCEIDGQVAGYCFLISFWSNELGGEICTIDELYVKPEFRGRGFAKFLFENLRSDRSLWPNPVVAFDLEVTPANKRARAFYEKLGFRDLKNGHMRLRFS